MPERRVYSYGWVYVQALEPLLRPVKKTIVNILLYNRLEPVLDVCCGTGAQCAMIQKSGLDAIGLDLDARIVAYGASRYLGTRLLCADAVRIPLRDASCRAAIVSFALHEKPQEMQTAILREVRRILQPEGCVILVDFERPWSFLSRLAAFAIALIERAAGREHFKHGRHFLAKGGLHGLIRRSGMEEICRKNVGFLQTGIAVARWSSPKHTAKGRCPNA